MINRIGRRLAPLICFAAAIGGGILHAQTIAIAPTGYLTAGPGAMQQFTATVSGDSMMGAAVNWFAGESRAVIPPWEPLTRRGSTPPR